MGMSIPTCPVQEGAGGNGTQHSHEGTAGSSVWLWPPGSELISVAGGTSGLHINYPMNAALFSVHESFMAKAQFWQMHALSLRILWVLCRALSRRQSPGCPSGFLLPMSGRWTPRSDLGCLHCMTKLFKTRCKLVMLNLMFSLAWHQLLLAAPSGEHCHAPFTSMAGRGVHPHISLKRFSYHFKSRLISGLSKLFTLPILSTASLHLSQHGVFFPSQMIGPCVLLTVPNPSPHHLHPTEFVALTSGRTVHTILARSVQLPQDFQLLLDIPMRTYLIALFSTPYNWPLMVNLRHSGTLRSFSSSVISNK